ncbi:MAG: tRNA pseudouridine(55) synthase TruB [Clostridia bacterium]|nr:tRNA pseudouridine(55) synthase TruB [Clostridia bacterium]
MNGILLVDKPAGFTSHDVVAKLRGILHERRIGHSGTLDPMATGLLVVFIGRATRAVQFAENHEKEYLAAMRTGIVTDTQDITGKIVKTSYTAVSASDIEAVLPEFTGEISQMPPMYSAIKIGGKKLYDIARKGGEVDRQPRAVTIFELSLTSEYCGDFLLRVRCSKGTYIRTLCHDIGQKLGCGAALSSLRRTKCGSFDVSGALTLDEISTLADSGKIEEALLPVNSLFSDCPAFTMTQFQREKCLCGSSFPVQAENGQYRVFDAAGEFMMLAQVQNGEMRVIKSFFEINN